MSESARTSTMRVSVDMDRVRLGVGPIIRIELNGRAYYADYLEVRGHVGLCLEGELADYDPCMCIHALDRGEEEVIDE